MLFQLAFADEITSAQQRGAKLIKHRLRRAFNAYLRRVWKHEKRLSGFLAKGLPLVPYPHKRAAADDELRPFYQCELGGYTWIPLVSHRNRLKVDLNIELLGETYTVLKANGDLD